MSLKSTFKGYLGERKVKKFLNKNKKLLNAKILNNAKFNINGKTIQIDHIFITPQKIYVIETKNLNGKIYGMTNDDYWTICYNDNKKFKILNPINQNSYHVKVIETITKVPYLCENIIIFTGKADLENLYNSSYYIKTIEDFKKIVFAETFSFLSTNIINVEKIYKLLKSNLSSFSRKQHIINIENRPKTNYNKKSKYNYYKRYYKNKF